MEWEDDPQDRAPMTEAIDTIASLRHQVDELKSEIQLITSPPEAVGNVIIALRRQLKDEHDAQERFAIRVLGQEEFDYSPCQAHPLELIEHHIEKLRRQLEALEGECENWKDSFERVTKQLANAKEAEKCAYENVDSTLDLLRRDCRRFRKQDADEYERQLAELRAERDQWKVDTKQLQSTLRVVEDENAELRVANNSLRNQRDEARAEIERLDAERRRDALDGQAALDEANNEIERLRVMRLSLW